MGKIKRVNLIAVVAGIVLGLSGWMTESANAHGLIVFAWVEGGQVYVEGKFSGGRKINAGEVTVEDSQGRILLSGKTDDQGRFAFPAPAKTDLKIIIQAGAGHQGEWTVSAAEFNAAGHGEKEKQPAKAPAAKDSAGDGRKNAQTAHTPSELAAIEAAVEKALDRKLKPVIQMLVDTRPSGPSLKDIFGGIGYILGLIGVGAYFHSRKKS